VKNDAASSTTNMTPAIGARNAVQMPQAAPVAKKSRASLGSAVKAKFGKKKRSMFCMRMHAQCATRALIWMMGPSGPMHRPLGTLAIIPSVFANVVCSDVKDVSLPVMGDLPPLGCARRGMGGGERGGGERGGGEGGGRERGRGRGER
jgi:hypothetical protein